jgi:hypothetical protein
MFAKASDARASLWQLYEDGQSRLQAVRVSAVRRARAGALWRYLTLSLGADLPLLLTHEGGAERLDPATEEIRSSGWTAIDIETAVDDLADAGLVSVEPAAGPVPFVVARVKGRSE